MVKGIFNAFDHMKFCLVLNLTTTIVGGKWAVVWPPFYATRYVSLLPTSAPGSKSKCLLPAKQVNFYHCNNPFLFMLAGSLMHLKSVNQDHENLMFKIQKL